MEELTISAPVFNIQPFSLHDGPGIRVTVFVKGCPLHCLWCANPESNAFYPQMMFYSGKCTACGNCIAVCPEQAVSIGEEDGKTCAVTNRTRCKNCGACVNACKAEAREMAGQNRTVKEVLDRVLQDKLFLDSSGGGMTISGGECLAHPDFTAALLHQAQLNDVHTAVETSVYSSVEVIRQVFAYVDLALLDIKQMDPEKHRQYTGVSNERILNNIRYLYHDLKQQMVIRIPCIPGYNDDDENISRTACFVKNELGSDVPVHLLPYHRLGEAKNRSLGKEMNFSIEPPTDEHMEHLKKLVEEYGLQAQIGG